MECFNFKVHINGIWQLYIYLSASFWIPLLHTSTPRWKLHFTSFASSLKINSR